jgi:aldehyde:ferredoxin oxidoreductase
LYGLVGKILKINLTDEKIENYKSADYFPEYIGGRGIAARIAWNEIPKGVGAFDPENKLIIMTGPLTGSLAPTSGRTVVCGVSPRVYPKPWYTHSTIGGFWGSELKYAGFDGLWLEGKARNPVYLWISDHEVEIIPAGNLWGMYVRTALKSLRNEHGEGIQVLTIGPAGENLVRYAAICHPPENASGHSGFGAVMGSKNLKSIVVKGTGGVRVARPSEFMETCKYAMKMCRTAAVHTHLMADLPSEVHLQPICSQSCNAKCHLGKVFFNTKSKFDNVTIKAHQAFCVGTCWMITEPQGGYEGGGLRVPPVTGWDAEGGGVDLHLLCDDLGLDLWLLLVFQPWFKRCLELGLSMINGEQLKPMDPYWFRDIIYKIAYRKGIGDLLAEDLLRMVQRLKDESSDLPEELIRLAEESEFAYGFPAHREGRIFDPEPMPFWVISALMYATENRDPTICTHSSFLHIAELYMHNPEVFRRDFRPIAKKVWGTEEAFEPSFRNKSKVAMWCQHRHILLDCLTMCDFAFPRIIKPIEKEETAALHYVYGDLDIEAKLFSACTGVDLSIHELEKNCERIFTLERMISVSKFNRNRDVDELVEPHFELPCKTDGTYLNKGIFKEILDDYYRHRGWDPETGIPTREKLKELGLENLV